MTDEELNKIWHIFHDIKDAKLSVFASNAFVAACFMHSKGEQEAAVKLLTALFNFIDTNKKETLISKIFKFLPGNEAILVSRVSSNVELRIKF
jgi:hypothetical protein